MNWLGSDDEARDGRRRFDPRSPVHWVVLVIVVGGLLLLADAFYVGPVVEHFSSDVPEADAGGGSFDEDAVVMGLVQSAAVLVGVPVLWVVTFHGGQAAGLVRRLRLRSQALVEDVGLGAVAGLGALLVSMVVMVVLAQFVDLPRNEVVEAMGGQFSWRLVLLVAIFSSTTEEVFFRGFLQPRIGIVPTNVLFGFAHLSYGIPMQVVVPMALGFLFSFMTQRRRSLVPAIVAHFVFNGVQLSLAKWVADSGLV